MVQLSLNKTSKTVLKPKRKSQLKSENIAPKKAKPRKRSPATLKEAPKEAPTDEKPDRVLRKTPSKNKKSASKKTKDLDKDGECGTAELAVLLLKREGWVVDGGS